MYRNAVAYLATIENAKAEGRLVPGAGLLIVEEVGAGTPARYRGDGLGDATHVGLYVGEKALDVMGEQLRAASHRMEDLERYEM